MINTFVALDIETTGLSPDKDKIIEIGAIKVEDGKVSGRFSKLINPQRKIPERIVELTGISDEMLINEPEEDVVIPEFLEFLEGHVLLGHNILFDYSFIKAHMDNKKAAFSAMGIDTLSLSRTFHEELASKSLENMCKYYGINNPAAHRAYEDAKAACKLYYELCEKFGGLKSEAFMAKPLLYKLPKVEPITNKQKNYLLDLIKYHKINSQSVLDQGSSMDELTKSQASRIIDKIILKHGRIV